MKNTTEDSSKRASKRLEIIETAYKLFSENGFYATGVDTIMRDLNISKRTMYVYFPTKNDLIVAVLAYYHSNTERELQAILAKNNLGSREKILAIFDNTGKWFGDTPFHGCLAVNAMGEFAGKDANIEDACRLFKLWELDMFRRLINGLTVSDPDGLAYKLLVLLEGIGAVAQVLQGACPIDLHQMVNTVIDSHILESP